jgi:hypothetical protein
VRSELQASLSSRSVLTCVANASVVDLNTDLVSLRGGNLDILNAKLLASFPGHSGLASDCLERTWSAPIKLLVRGVAVTGGADGEGLPFQQ